MEGYWIREDEHYEVRTTHINFVIEHSELFHISPEEMKAIYKDSRLTFGPGYIVPKPFDRRLFTEVSSAVAHAAVESGVARKAEALKDYPEQLQQRLKTMWQKQS